LNREKQEIDRIYMINRIRSNPEASQAMKDVRV